MKKSHPKVILEKKKAVALVTINNLERHNSLSRAVMTELITVLKRIAVDSSVRVVVLTGAGTQSFSVGLDLKELTAQGKVIIDDLDAKSRTMGVDSPLVKAISDLPQPLIGAINGFAITGGFELALACDFLVCSTHAQFADTHALVGLLPGWGLSQKLPHLIGLNHAKELSFTGRYVGANEAKSLGIVNHVFEPNDLMPQALKVADRIAQSDTIALQSIKSMMNLGSQMPLAQALIMEGDLAQEYNDQLNFSHLEERLKTLRTAAKK